MKKCETLDKKKKKKKPITFVSTGGQKCYYGFVFNWYCF